MDLVDVFLGPDGVLTGSAREAFKLQEEESKALHSQALNIKENEIQRKSEILEGKIAELKLEFESAKDKLNRMYIEEELQKENAEKTQRNITNIRRNYN